MLDPTPNTIELWGGALCLDLANSADWNVAGESVEPERNDVLRSPSMLEAWARRLGLAGSEPVSGDELNRVRDLRAALHRLFSSVVRDEAADPVDLTLLHETFAEATGVGTLARGGGAWRWTWDEDDPRRARFAIAVDAVALLGDPARLPRLHRCPGHECGWLFLDRTGRRRWCSMAACGSREKMRRLYARRKAA
jgi:predicted RNA-binding Zn ribbon-like protein